MSEASRDRDGPGIENSQAVRFSVASSSQRLKPAGPAARSTGRDGRPDPEPPGYEPPTKLKVRAGHPSGTLVPYDVIGAPMIS